MKPELVTELAKSARARRTGAAVILGVVFGLLAAGAIFLLLHGIKDPIVNAVFWAMAAGTPLMVVLFIRAITGNINAGLEALGTPETSIVWAYTETTTSNHGKTMADRLHLGLADGRLVKFAARSSLVHDTLDGLKGLGVTVGYSKERKKAFRKSPRALAAAM